MIPSAYLVLRPIRRRLAEQGHMGRPPVDIANVDLVMSIVCHREIALHLNCAYNGGHVFELGAADGEVPSTSTLPSLSLSVSRFFIYGSPNSILYISCFSSFV
jgi:hypothetical protein